MTMPQIAGEELSWDQIQHIEVKRMLDVSMNFGVLILSPDWMKTMQLFYMRALSGDNQILLRMDVKPDDIMILKPDGAVLGDIFYFSIL